MVEDLEATVAALLGAEAAVFMVSGTMAQQIALRIHADRLGARTVAFHPTCHVEVHEQKAFERLHGLVGRPVGDATVPLSVADLASVHEPLAAIVIELPQREIGGHLPAWEDLTAQVAWARDRGAAVHLDGARLWECTPFYGRPESEIAGLFDSVYVSFYKGLGAMAGCCLAGTAEVVARAREWRTRHGGTLFAMWPYAASALAALQRRRDRMTDYRAHAVAIADAVRDLAGVEIVPDPPMTPMMHVHLRTTEERFTAQARRIARERRTWTWHSSRATARPRWRMVELAVGDASLDIAPAEVRELLGSLADPAGGAPPAEASR